MDKRLIKTSKFLSFVLRHKPERIGIILDGAGWVGVDELLDACKRHEKPISHEELLAVVDQNDKKRFVIRDGRIRANQGHSIDVQLSLKPTKPPEYLYHGTADRFVESITTNGLLKMKRQHVHLSWDKETARRVGMRHGHPVIIRIRALNMHSAGYEFFLSENGVWLTNSVPSQYLIWEF